MLLTVNYLEISKIELNMHKECGVIGMPTWNK